MAISSRTLKVLKALYWLVCVAVHLVVVLKLFQIQHVIAGAIWLVAGLVLIYVFYGYFFPKDGEDGKWPPFIRPCPDYLTQIAPGKCVDYVGMGGQLKKSDPQHPPAVTNSEYVFDAMGTMAQKAQNAKSYGLSWEGIA